MDLPEFTRSPMSSCVVVWTSTLSALENNIGWTQRLLFFVFFSFNHHQDIITPG